MRPVLCVVWCVVRVVGVCAGFTAVCGASEEIRTLDRPLTRRLLYQLSYAGVRVGCGAWCVVLSWIVGVISS